MIRGGLAGHAARAHEAAARVQRSAMRRVWVALADLVLLIVIVLLVPAVILVLGLPIARIVNVLMALAAVIHTRSPEELA